MMQPGDDLTGAGTMLAQASQDAHFDLVPSRLPCGLATSRAKRDHHPIDTEHQGSGHQSSLQQLGLGQVVVRQSL
jgi:hypothetical protein